MSQVVRLWPYYHVTYTTECGGDWIETSAQNEADAASIAFHQHMCPGFRVTNVEFARWNPNNRAMMGLRFCRDCEKDASKAVAITDTLPKKSA